MRVESAGTKSLKPIYGEPLFQILDLNSTCASTPWRTRARRAEAELDRLRAAWSRSGGGGGGGGGGVEGEGGWGSGGGVKWDAGSSAPPKHGAEVEVEAEEEEDEAQAQDGGGGTEEEGNPKEDNAEETEQATEEEEEAAADVAEAVVAAKFPMSAARRLNRPTSGSSLSNCRSTSVSLSNPVSSALGVVPRKSGSASGGGGGGDGGRGLHSSTFGLIRSAFRGIRLVVQGFLVTRPAQVELRSGRV